jgi:hypothetical protein
MLLNVTESVSQMKEYVEAVDLRAELVALIQLCQSMHYILVPTDKALEQAGDNMPDVEMNPCKLMCTCKGFRMIGLCSHTMALTCRLDNGYNQAFLESLLQKLVTKKRAKHRPKKTVGGKHKQPHGDSSSDDSDHNDDYEDDLDYL